MRLVKRCARHVMFGLVLTLLAAGCAHTHMKWDDRYPVGPVMLHAIVDGDAAALQVFHAQMQQLFGISNLEDAYIACLGCAELDKTPPARLDYYYVQAHADRPGLFQQARLNTQALGRQVSVSFDADTRKLGTGACPTGSGYPTNCVPAPYCTLTAQCDRYQGPPCQVCKLP